MAARKDSVPPQYVASSSPSADRCYLFQDDGASGLARSDLLIGSGLIFLSGAAWSIYVVLCKPLIQRYGSYKISALTLAIAAFPSFSWSLATPCRWRMNLNASALFSLFFLIVVATFMALMLWNFATGILRPTAIGATLYLVPVLAVLSGYVLLNEAVTTKHPHCRRRHSPGCGRGPIRPRRSNPGQPGRPRRRYLRCLRMGPGTRCNALPGP